jgi:hypothetical protein
MSGHLTKRDTVAAAMSIAEDVTSGRLAPAALESEVTTACRELFGQVIGEGDPLFDLQIEVARGVLAAGGLGVDELAEWLAVQRHREAGGPDIPAGPVSSASGPHSSIPGGPDGGG